MSGTISAAISAAVRVVREASGLTREDVVAGARAAGAPESFTVAVLRNVESGRRAPAVDEVAWIAAALQVPPRELLGEHADLFGAAAVAPECGPVEEATRRAVEALPDVDDRGSALAESAYALARALDGGTLTSPAPVAREIRATLAMIWDGQASGEEDDGFDPE